MRDFNKRRSAKNEPVRAVVSALVIAVLLLVAYVAVTGAWGMYQKFTAAAAARAAAEAELQDLESHQTAVKEDVDSLATSRGVEAAVRERYGVAKPGEGEIDIVRTASTSAPIAAPQSLWQRLWHLVFFW